jgi:hypothetical protein
MLHHHKTSKQLFNHRLECNYLRRNFLTCLKEKSVKDDVEKMNCNVELVTICSLSFYGIMLDALTHSSNLKILNICATPFCSRKDSTAIPTGLSGSDSVEAND